MEKKGQIPEGSQRKRYRNRSLNLGKRKSELTPLCASWTACTMVMPLLERVKLKKNAFGDYKFSFRHSEIKMPSG